MRIIAGKHRGRVLAAFRGNAVRPTPDRVKESLFQILSDRLRGARVLDLFAGSGALGLEALSRGAKEAVFCDVSEESLDLVRRNLRLLGESGTVLRLDFAACLQSVSPAFDVIFCDPPYRENYAERVLTLAAERNLLAPRGVVVYESEREEEAPAGWRAADRRKYGRTRVVLFERSEQ